MDSPNLLLFRLSPPLDKLPTARSRTEKPNELGDETDGLRCHQSRTQERRSVRSAADNEHVQRIEKKPQTGVGAREEEEREGAEFKASEDLRELDVFSSSRGV